MGNGGQSSPHACIVKGNQAGAAVKKEKRMSDNEDGGVDLSEASMDEIVKRLEARLTSRQKEWAERCEPKLGKH